MNASFLGVKYKKYLLLSKIRQLDEVYDISRRQILAEIQWSPSEDMCWQSGYLNLEMKSFSLREKQDALKICRTLVNLSEKGAVVILLQGFNYEGPGPIVGFRYAGQEFLLPQVTK